MEDRVFPEDEEDEEGAGLVVGIKLPSLELFLENVGLECPRRGSPPRSSLLPEGPATLRLCPGELPGAAAKFGDGALDPDDDTLNW